jgi:hypothetical protein
MLLTGCQLVNILDFAVRLNLGHLWERLSGSGTRGCLCNFPEGSYNLHEFGIMYNMDARLQLTRSLQNRLK